MRVMVFGLKIRFLISNSIFFFGTCQFCMEYRKILAYKAFINSTEQPFLYCDTPNCIQTENVVCALRYQRECTGPDEWVVGIAETLRPRIDPLMLKCCSYAPMKFSTALREVVLKTGESFEGGYMFRDNSTDEVIAYDIIKTLTKNFEGERLPRAKRHLSPTYTVQISRLNCVPEPPEYTNAVDPALDEVPDLTTEMINNEFMGHPNPEQGLVNPCCDACCPVCCPMEPQCCTPAACFAADTIVTTPDGPRNVQDLKVGDYVLSYELNHVHFALVESFWHFMPDKEAAFMRISTVHATDLLISEHHFIYVTSCDENLSARRGQLLQFESYAIYAKDLIAEKHCLWTIGKDSKVPKTTRIISISKERKTGIFAPMTSNGRIIVNELLASCFSEVNDPALTRNLVSWTQQLVSFDWIPFKNWWNYQAYDNDYVELPTVLSVALKLINEFVFY